MSLIKLLAFPTRRALPYVHSKNLLEPLCSVTCNSRLVEKPNDNFIGKISVYQVPVQRSLHVTPVRKDMEAAFKNIGAGLAATAIIGPGVGMGILFGNLISGISRNPSMANKLFQFAIMGAAFTESLALFGLVIAFLCMQ